MWLSMADGGLDGSRLAALLLFREIPPFFGSSFSFASESGGEQGYLKLDPTLVNDNLLRFYCVNIPVEGNRCRIDQFSSTDIYS